MPTPTYTPLATVTLGTAKASVTFSSIPATYRDLVLVCDNLKTTLSTSAVFIRFNGASSGYSNVLMRGNGTDAVSSSPAATSDRTFVTYSAEPTASNPTNCIVQIMDYSATDKHKTVLSRSNNASDATEALAGRYASTSAITSLQVGMDGALSFAAGSTFSLYGVIA
jgi:hypothetical protein